MSLLSDHDDLLSDGEDSAALLSPQAGVILAQHSPESGVTASGRRSSGDLDGGLDWGLEVVL